MLKVLTPNFDKWDHSTVQNWIKKLHRVGNCIETVLNFKTESNSEAEKLKITNRSRYVRIIGLSNSESNASMIIKPAIFTDMNTIIIVDFVWVYSTYQFIVP